jgi:hypothetical protein
LSAVEGGERRGRGMGSPLGGVRLRATGGGSAFLVETLGLARSRKT